MTATDLVLTMIKHSNELHPAYTKENHLIWALGMLADAVVEQDRKDNIVLTTLRQRLDKLYASK
jgi:hypothetical protein